jgi:nicotinate-nucleotide pyrophosphorylase (carboxylating)
MVKKRIDSGMGSDPPPHYNLNKTYILKYIIYYYQNLSNLNPSKIPSLLTINSQILHMNLRLLKEQLLSYIKEDVYFEDITSKLVQQKTVNAEIILKESGVIAGIEEVRVLCRMFNINLLTRLNDGDIISNPQRIALLRGKSTDILLIERTALNILSKMSGIATLTKTFKNKASKANPKVRIAATRKTTPGFRYFEKKAVETAGGDSHRMSLSDMVLIKDNHLKLLGSVKKALAKAKHETFAHKIEIEVTTKKDAIAAASGGADVILLDNMKTEDIRDILRTLSKKGMRSSVITEASGGITLDNVSEYAKTGVDVISTSMLTSSYHALDMSLEII